MGVQELSKTVVDALPPKDSLYIVYDENITGFCVRVMPSGFKSYLIEWRTPGSGRAGGKRRMSIGTTTGPKAITFEQARKRAKSLLASVTLGKDPLNDREAQRAADKREKDAATVASLVSDYLDKHVAKKRKGSTHKGYEYLADKLIVPALGKIKAAELDRPRVAKFHLDLSKTPYQANRALAVISAAYEWGGRYGYVAEGFNPARGVDKYKEERRQRFLTTEEIESIGSAFAETEKRYGVYAAAGIRLLLLTGARIGEILTATWSEVDFQRKIIFKKDSKTGQKPIKLSKEALAVLSSLPRVDGCDFIIVGKNPKAPRSGLKRIWDTFKTEAGLQGVRLHDLRHTFASVAAGRGHSLPIIGSALGHAEARTTQRYAHLADNPLAVAVEDVSGDVASSLVRGASRDNVVSINGGRR